MMARRPRPGQAGLNDKRCSAFGNGLEICSESYRRETVEGQGQQASVNRTQGGCRANIMKGVTQ